MPSQVIVGSWYLCGTCPECHRLMAVSEVLAVGQTEAPIDVAVECPDCHQTQYFAAETLQLRQAQLVRVLSKQVS